MFLRTSMKLMALAAVAALGACNSVSSAGVEQVMPGGDGDVHERRWVHEKLPVILMSGEIERDPVVGLAIFGKRRKRLQ